MYYRADSDIRICNQFLMTRALHFAKLALETLKLYSAIQCHSDACLIIRLWLCKIESTSRLIRNWFLILISRADRQKLYEFQLYYLYVGVFWWLFMNFNHIICIVVYSGDYLWISTILSVSWCTLVTIYEFQPYYLYGGVLWWLFMNFNHTICIVVLATLVTIYEFQPYYLYRGVLWWLFMNFNYTLCIVVYSGDYLRISIIFHSVDSNFLPPVRFLRVLFFVTYQLYAH